MRFASDAASNGKERYVLWSSTSPNNIEHGTSNFSLSKPVMPARFLRELIICALARPEAHQSRRRFSAVRPLSAVGSFQPSSDGNDSGSMPDTLPLNGSAPTGTAMLRPSHSAEPRVIDTRFCEQPVWLARLVAESGGLSWGGKKGRHAGLAPLHHLSDPLLFAGRIDNDWAARLFLLVRYSSGCSCSSPAWSRVPFTISASALLPRLDGRAKDLASSVLRNVVRVLIRCGGSSGKIAAMRAGPDPAKLAAPNFHTHQSKVETNAYARFVCTGQRIGTKPVPLFPSEGT